MKNSRGVSFNKGDTVRFEMPIEGLDTGVVVGIDGSYVYIKFGHEPQTYVIERYESEILECLSIR